MLPVVFMIIVMLSCIGITGEVLRVERGSHTGLTSDDYYGNTF